jgi:PelA/Pel-15E family pectate lyase
MQFLMSLDSPSQKVTDAVHAAADWFRANEKHGVRYDPKNGVHVDSMSGPVWARLTEITTGRPIFANRDGVRLYDWTLLTDRRVGYAWFSDEPLAALRTYEEWSREHPRSEGGMHKP